MSDRVERALKEWSNEEWKLAIQKRTAATQNRKPRELIPIITKRLETEGWITCPLAKDLYGFEGDNSTFRKCIVKKIRETGLTIHEKMGGRTKLYYTDKYISVDPQTKSSFNTVNEVMISYIIDAVKDDLEAGNEINIYDLLDENRDIFPAIYKGTKGDRNTNRQQMMEKLTTEFAKGYSYTRIKKGIFITNVASHKGEK